MALPFLLHVSAENVEKGQANHSIKRPIFIPKIY